MKYYIVLAVLAFAVAIDAALDHCKSSEDCKEDECCLQKMPMFGKPECLPKAKEGESCSKKDSDQGFPQGGKYWVNCPCSEDLSCSKVTGDNKFLKVLKCSKGGTEEE